MTGLKTWVKREYHLGTARSCRFLFARRAVVVMRLQSVFDDEVSWQVLASTEWPSESEPSIKEAFDSFRTRIVKNLALEYAGVS